MGRQKRTKNMILVLLLTLIWCGAVVIAACACASRSDKSIRNMRRNRLRKYLAASRVLH